ncbi:hypothetical protein CDG81_05160 [Actinopolyspora erythraea]|uniref:ATP synthase protein I n=1 Tax=Actinopolyspora erythraea TaxID=414996 RepID=A0A099D2M7_9ACTN|nr:hypothetical protein [Actinopolyspora erythraea]ASU77795.1 hypothetical protein CDG81_05160 [Actinopolyspora erythraea]KGI80012.1 hypothetical protein IL38_20150 [Actinopolyspora erythraea]
MTEATGTPDSTDRPGVEETNPHARTVRRLAAAMLRAAVLPGALAVLLCTVVAAFLVGTPGLLGGLIGGAVAFGSSLLTLWLMRSTADFHPMFVMVAALGGYIGKMVVLFVVVTLLRGLDFVDVRSVALTILATVLVWTAAEVHGFRRTRTPTIVLPGRS